MGGGQTESGSNGADVVPLAIMVVEDEMLVRMRACERAALWLASS